VGWEPTLLVVPFILTALGALYLAGEAWRRSRSSGSLSYALLMLVIVVWLLTSSASLLSVLPEQKIFWAKATYFGVAWLATLWFTFALEYFYPNNRFLESAGWALWIIPSATVLIVATNELHGWMWSEIIPAPGGSGALLYQRSVWFYVFFVYSYALLAAGMAVMIRAITSFRMIHRRQVVALILGMALPWLANISYAVGWIPQTSIDLTPFAFSIGGILYTFGLFRLRLFDPVPRAREFILEQIGEGYLALDSQDTILDINPSARRLLRLDDKSLSGQPAAEILSGWPALVGLLRSTTQTRVELEVQDEPAHFLEASLSPWYTRKKRYVGRILTLYDVTRRKHVEERLRDSEELYRLLVHTSPDGITRIDEDCRITFASPQVLDLLRVENPQRLIGEKAMDWVHPEDRRLVEEQLSRNTSARPSSATYRLVRSDRTTFWGEVMATVMLNERGQARGTQLTIRDVTERIKLELRLKINLEQQRFINDLLQILYHPHDLLSALGEVLEQTGIYTHTSRIYLCRDSQDGQETFIELEWCGENAKPRAHEAPFVRYSAIPTWRRFMEIRGMVLAPSTEILPQLLSLEALMGDLNLVSIERNQTVPHDIADFMTIWDISSLAAFPIYGSEERLYGFLGFDDCGQVRAWSGEELTLMWNVCKIVSSAVAQMQVEEEERRQRAMTEALQDTAHALNSTLNSEEVLDRILANLEKVAQYDAASIAMVDEEGIVSFVRWRGYNENGTAWMQDNKIPLGARETYTQMAASGEPTLIRDTWLDRTWRGQEEFRWIRSYAGVPIQIKGKVAGFINLDSAQPDFFTPEIAGRLRVFADQAAVAIDNARLYHSAQQRADEMSILYRIGLTLTSGLEMNDVLAGLFEQCRQVLPIDVFYVSLYNEGTKVIDHGLFYKEGEFLEIQPRKIDTQPSLGGAVILERRTIYLPDTLQPDLTGRYQILRLGGSPARSYVGVPLIVLNQVVGVMSMQSLQPNAYSPEQIRLFETIATQAAIVVQNARLYDQMRQMAITDTVTGLFNRRHFSAQGQGEVERARRYNRALSVLMVDIDHFKIVNDTYGHNAGDLVLQAVARVCRQALRVTDIVGRWGGEEFTIVLPEADVHGAVLIGERIRRMMEETQVEIAEGKHIRVTVCVGVATLSPDCDGLERIVNCADYAMYQAKQAGRNRVETFKGELTAVLGPDGAR
jgi:diguanylate cyclase (GGDEF)-like protein/PAS domain S-box-containing protein